MLFSSSCMRLGFTTGLVVFLTSVFGTATSLAAPSSNKVCLASDLSSDFTNWEIIGRKQTETIKSPKNPSTTKQVAFLDTFSQETVNVVELAKFLGVEVNNLVEMGEVYEGSAIKKSITVEAGDTLTFDWNFFTDDFRNQANNDFAFFTLTSLGETKLADTFSRFSNNQNNPTSFLHQTGFQIASYTFTRGGTYSLGIGVVDVQDGAVDSGLMLDNFSLTRRPI